MPLTEYEIGINVRIILSSSINQRDASEEFVRASLTGADIVGLDSAWFDTAVTNVDIISVDLNIDN